MDEVFVENGDKFVPMKRFDLEAARSSTAFGKSARGARKDIEVRRHPVVQSIKASQIETQQSKPSAAQELKVGQVYHGKVVAIMDFGANVEILPNTVGLLHISELSSKRIETMEASGLKVGSEIDVKLIEIDEKANKLRLSVKALTSQSESSRENRRPGNRPLHGRATASSESGNGNSTSVVRSEERGVERRFTEAFSFREETKRSTTFNRTPAVRPRDFIKAKLSLDMSQERVCLDICCGSAYLSTRRSYETQIFFPISSFISEGKKEEKKGTLKGVSVVKGFHLQGTYDQFSCEWDRGRVPAEKFPSWLPASEFMMRTVPNAKEGPIIVQGKVVFVIERKDKITVSRTIIEEQKKETIGEIIGALEEEKQLIPDYPVINDESTLTNESILTCIDGSKCTIPDIELTPYNNILFRYEDVSNGEGNFDSKLGFVHLSYGIKLPKPGVKGVPVEIDSARLNLKTTKGIVSIDGEVDTLAHKLNFNLKDEAVKIAFFNLISRIKATQCDVDIFFKFGGYAIQKKNTRIFRKLDRSARDLSRQKSFARKKLTPEVMVPVKQKAKMLAEANAEPVYVKSKFIVKINKSLSYPLEDFPNLFRHFYEIIKGNPFKLNDDFAEYKQVFCPGFERVVNIYKSLFSTNNFLLFPNKYYLARNDKQACIDSAMFLTEEGVSEEEQSISKVNFSFTIAPALSSFDLAKLKLRLIENGMLDTVSEEEAKKPPFDRIRFNFPNDIGAETEINGDAFFAESDITQDGKYFNIIRETGNFADASLFITAMNSGITRPFNIVSRYKDLTNSALVELDMGKTIGDFLSLDIEDGEILAYNNSYSPCHISNLMLINKEGEAFFNSKYFKNSEEIGEDESVLIKISDLTDNEAFQQPKDVLAEYESIEDLSKEFHQEVDQLTSYYRKVILDLSSIDEEVSSVELKITHVSTGCIYPFVRERDQFEQAIQLTLISKYEKEPVTKLLISRKFIDENGNTIQNDSMEWDYSESAIIDLSLTKQE